MIFCASTFVFNPELTHVALILKNRPDFLKGKLTAIGGRIEDHEDAADTAKRELLEEASLDVGNVQYFATTHRPGFHCYMFWAIALMVDARPKPTSPSASGTSTVSATRTAVCSPTICSGS